MSEVANALLATRLAVAATTPTTAAWTGSTDITVLTINLRTDSHLFIIYSYIIQ
jgi:hypothetical protein